MLPDRLTWIDETNRDQHYFLDAADRCLFSGDFFGGKGWSGGYTNQLITNYKRTPNDIAVSVKSTQLQYYKDRAISEISAALRQAFGPDGVKQRTFVPIPTSKVSSDPNYCDRLERTLRFAFQGFNADIRNLLRQKTSTDADHRSGSGRRTYEDLLEITKVDATQLATPLQAEVVLFDDVLTSGKHFKVAKSRICEINPGQPILGIFVARCIHATINPFEEFEDLDG